MYGHRHGNTSCYQLCSVIHGPCGEEDIVIISYQTCGMEEVYNSLFTPSGKNDPQSLHAFQDHINSSKSTIKFTFECSDKQVPFLDVMVYLENNQLSNNLFSKQTDSYTRISSKHLVIHTFKSIVYYNSQLSQAIRVRRICSNHQETETKL